MQKPERQDDFQDDFQDDSVAFGQYWETAGPRKELVLYVTSSLSSETFIQQESRPLLNLSCFSLP